VLVSNPDLPDPNLEGFRERIWVRNYPCACCGNDNMVSMEFIVKQYYSVSGLRIDQGNHWLPKFGEPSHASSKMQVESMHK